ncbi:MAG TPA: TonB-dependent receptor plug domain-containing protein, partial [Hanamia sp.]
MKRNFKFLVVSLLILLSQSIQAQTFPIKGNVSAKNNSQLLAGASVSVKNTSNHALTDEKGNFEINAADKSTLIISFIGYRPQEVVVTSPQTFIQISLDKEDNILNEVVVTALGISKQKKSLGYSVQELKAKDISEAKETNLVNALSGKIAGVNVTNSQGDMGSSRIIIRGETSIDGQNQPLFVVDGVPVDNSQLLGTGGSRDFSNAISDINSEDIESISVLKGPNAAALYGSRSAAGVILIKTKTGKNQKG